MSNLECGPKCLRFYFMGIKSVTPSVCGVFKVAQNCLTTKIQFDKVPNKQVS